MDSTAREPDPATEAPRWRVVRARPLGGEKRADSLTRELRGIRDRLFRAGREPEALVIAQALLDLRRLRVRVAT